jgi:hypothetical protein
LEDVGEKDWKKEAQNNNIWCWRRNSKR